MSHDPLDDLIEQLEASIPTASENPPEMLKFDDVTWMVGGLLWGDEEQRARHQKNPRFQQLAARFAASVRGPDDRDPDK